MSSSAQKDVKQLIKVAEQQGWTVTRTGTLHLRWQAPDGRVLFRNGTSPSDRRAVANLRSDLRRLGLRLPRKDGRVNP
jgi:hypothetical protein